MKKNTVFQLQSSEKRLEIIRLALTILILTVAVNFSIPARGFISTIPIIVIAVAVVTFFYDEPVRIVSIVAMMAAFLSIFDKSPAKFIIVFTLEMSVLTLAVIFGIRFMKRFLSKSKRNIRGFSLAVALVILCAVFAVFFRLNGNPIAAAKENSDVRDYLSLAYPDKEFDSIDTNYSIFDGIYETVISYDDTGAELKSKIVKTENGFEDSYFEFVKDHMLSDRLEELIDTVTENNNDNLRFRSAGVTFAAGSEEARGISYSGNNSAFYNDMNFDIMLGNYTGFQRDFVSECKKVADIIIESKFEFNKITIFGGTAAGYKFQYRFAPTTDIGKIMDEIEDFDASGTEPFDQN